MGLFDRLQTLLGDKFDLITSKKVAIVGQCDTLTYYTIISLVSSGFGFGKPIYLINPEIYGEGEILFDEAIDNFSSLEKFINEKFPGAKIKLLTSIPNEIISSIKFLNPDIIINLSKSEKISEKLNEFKDKTIDAIVSDFIYVGPLTKVNKIIRYHRPPYLEQLLASPIIAYSVMYKLLSNKFATNLISGKLIEDINYLERILLKRDLLIIGAGAIGNWFLEVVSPYLSNRSRILIVDFDTIEDHNVLRQQFYYVNDVGKKKSKVLSERLRKKFRLLGKDVEVSYLDKKIEKRSLNEIEREVRDFLGDTVDFCVFVDNKLARYYAAKLYERFDGNNFLISTSKTNLYNPQSFSILFDNYQSLKQSGYAKYSRKKGRSCIAPGSIVHPFSISGVTSLLTLISKQPTEISLPVEVKGKVQNFYPPKYYAGLQQVYDAFHKVNCGLFAEGSEEILKYEFNASMNKEYLYTIANNILRSKCKYIRVGVNPATINKDPIELASLFYNIGIPPVDAADLLLVSGLSESIVCKKAQIEKVYNKIKGSEEEKMKRILHAYVAIMLYRS